MTKRLTADVAICTIGPEGIKRAAQIPQHPLPGIRYIVSWQKPGNTPLPHKLEREDVTVVTSGSVGLSANRNNALQHSSADIIVWLDDDVELSMPGLQQLLRCYERCLHTGVMVFKMGQPSKHYPECETILGRRLPKGYYVSGCEISARRRFLPAKPFREYLGLGAPELQAGEDEVFICDAIRHGLECRYVPVEVCRHPMASTGTKSNPTAGTVKAMGFTMMTVWGCGGILRLPLKAWRLWRRQWVNPAKALLWLLTGATIALRKKP